MKGICNKCGKCCEVIALRVPKDAHVLHEYFSARGLRTDPDDPEAVLVPSRCQHLEGGKCEIYEDRPTICRLYPMIGISYIPEGCSYRGNKSAAKTG